MSESARHKYTYVIQCPICGDTFEMWTGTSRYLPPESLLEDLGGTVCGVCKTRELIRRIKEKVRKRENGNRLNQDNRRNARDL